MDYFPSHDRATFDSVLNFIKDTPVKISTPLTTSYRKTMAVDVDRKVAEELLGHVFTTDTKMFLDGIFPLKTGEFVAKDVLDHLQRQQQFSSSGWKGLFKEPTIENTMYGPFTDACNAIRLACRDLCQYRTGTCIQWYDRHSKAPKSVDKDAADIRPDVIAALAPDEGHDNAVLTQLDGDIRVARQREKEAGAAASSSGAGSGPQPSKSEDKTAKLVDIWWQRVHCIVELKVKNDEKSVKDAAQQLFGYMRQVFREQINRRFVIGLVLCGSDMTVWVSDKAGVIGTSTPFNIHQSPELFIQVIAGLSLLSYAQLGWDTTMRIRLPNSRHTSFPWDACTLNNTITSPYQIQWEIEMPSRDVPGERETFLTLKPLSLLRSEVMYGRGSVVWAVCKATDPPGPQRRIYVLKQCARPSTSWAEGSFYELAKNDETSSGSAQLGALYSWENVSIPDYPAEALKNLRDTHSREPTSNKTTDKKRPREETTESLLQIACNDMDAVNEIKSSLFSPSSREFVRTLVEPYGWPVKFFKHRLELLVCLRDAIKAHKFLYQRGILHRDISTGNILICPLEGDAGNTAGRLFDLDYAKLTRTFGKSEVTGISPQVMDKIEKYIKNEYPPGIERTALMRLLSYFPDKPMNSLTYIEDILRLRGMSSSSLQCQLTCADIGLLPEDEAAKIPIFVTHKSQQMHRTGTGPFMSSELATQMITFRRGKLDHDSLHDMESFLWVLVYLCCTRDGPGGNRRKEFTEEFSTSPHKMLRAVVYFFFESPIAMMGRYKQNLFKNQTDLETLLLPVFHEYFLPLRSLVREWFEILLLGFEYRIYETIHDQFLNAIEKAIEKESLSEEENPEILKATKAELERRRNDLEELSREPISDYAESTELPLSSTQLQNDQSPSRPRSNSDRARLYAALTGNSDDPFRDASQSERSQPELKKFKTEPL